MVDHQHVEHQRIGQRGRAGTVIIGGILTLILVALAGAFVLGTPGSSTSAPNQRIEIQSPPSAPNVEVPRAIDVNISLPAQQPAAQQPPPAERRQQQPPVEPPAQIQLP